MANNKQFLVLLTLVLLTLLLRDLPYLNVIFVSRIWLIYFAILLFVIFAGIKFRVTLLWFVTFVLLCATFALTILRLSFFAESIGVLIYFLLWAIVIHRLIGFVKDRR